MLAKGRGNEASTKRRDLKFRLLAERLTGRPQEDGFINDAMRWGTEHEDEAVRAYEVVSGHLVEAVGFLEHDDLPAGTSPDGLIDADGILSIKCPKTSTQIGYVRAGVEPAEHWHQNTHELWLTQRAYVQFVSYDPRLPDDMGRLFQLRCTRTAAELAAYDKEVKAFLAEVDAEVQALRTMTNLSAVLQEAAHAV